MVRFKIAVNPGAPLSRTELAQDLDRHQIGNRMLFGRNLLRQPQFVQRRQHRQHRLDAVRLVTYMEESDSIMVRTLFLGPYPGVCEERFNYETAISASLIQSLSSTV